MPIVYGIAEAINSFFWCHTGSGVVHKTLANALKAVLGGLVSDYKSSMGRASGVLQIQQYLSIRGRAV